jgi:antitoxin HicB
MVAMAVMPKPAPNRGHLALARHAVTKTAMARCIGTTRAQLDRLLDPDYPSAALATLVKVANAVGKRVKISLVNA